MTSTSVPHLGLSKHVWEILTKEKEPVWCTNLSNLGMWKAKRALNGKPDASHRLAVPSCFGAETTEGTRAMG